MNKITNNNKRNLKTPNDFIIHEDCVEIRLYGGYPDFTYLCSTYVDLDDYDKVKDYKWYYGGNGYAANTKLGTLHRYVYPNQDEIENAIVDHINQDKLDNRKSNLRIASQPENGANRGKNKNNTTGYKNISHCEKRKFYYVGITLNKKRYTKSISYGSLSGRTQQQALQLAIDYRDDIIKIHGKDFGCTGE